MDLNLNYMFRAHERLDILDAEGICKRSTFTSFLGGIELEHEPFLWGGNLFLVRHNFLERLGLFNLD